MRTRGRDISPVWHTVYSGVDVMCLVGPGYSVMSYRLQQFIPRAAVCESQQQAATHTALQHARCLLAHLDHIAGDSFAVCYLVLIT